MTRIRRAKEKSVPAVRWSTERKPVRGYEEKAEDLLTTNSPAKRQNRRKQKRIETEANKGHKDFVLRDRMDWYLSVSIRG